MDGGIGDLAPSWLLRLSEMRGIISGHKLGTVWTVSGQWTLKNDLESGSACQWGVQTSDGVQ